MAKTTLITLHCSTVRSLCINDLRRSFYRKSVPIYRDFWLSMKDALFSLFFIELPKEFSYILRVKFFENFFGIFTQSFTLLTLDQLFKYHFGLSSFFEKIFSIKNHKLPRCSEPEVKLQSYIPIYLQFLC